MPPTAHRELLEIAADSHEAGRLAEAERLYRQVLSDNPDNSAALHGLGVLAHQAGQHAAAVDLIQQALRHAPESPVYLSNLGESLRALGRLDEAIACYRRAIALRPDLAQAHNNLGVALRTQGRTEDALAAFRRAVELLPNYADAHTNLGLAFHDLNQLDNAIAAHRRAIAIAPRFAAAHYNLGNALVANKQHADAVTAYLKAIELRPAYADAHNNLGSAYEQLDRIDEAIAAYRRALDLRPDWIEVYSNLCIALQMSGKLDEALAVCERAIALKPDAPSPHWNRALLLLTRGDFERGWPEYEWRFAMQKTVPPRPAWDGSDPAGLTILLQAEQGFGDTIQFVRYAPLLARRGARVILECQPELKMLLEGVEGVEQVIARGEPLPGAGAAVDRRVALMSLPLLFKTTLETIPANVPYLKPDPAKVAKWRERIGTDGKTRNIGIAWAGRPTHPNDRRRSMTLEEFATLVNSNGLVPNGGTGMRFFSLQKGEAAGEAKRPPRGMELIDHTQELSDFRDTAALVACLDLVIAVDTAVVHLAGAMGKPVCVVVPEFGDWRWMLGREASPWYPTMRVVRVRREFGRSSGTWSGAR